MNPVIKPAAFHKPKTKEQEGFISDRLAAFAADFDLAKVPDHVVERAKLNILDCLGIGFASTTYDFGQRTVNAIHGLAGEGDLPVIGMAMRLPLRDSVLVNGTLIHGLDFDDTHSGAVVHASASAVPTVIGAGLAYGASGAEALSAYLVAVETSSRIGMAVKGGFHRKGHHPTGLVGAFGCTLAAGYLGDLSEKQMASAQGIVLSMGSGNQEFLADGAWTKRMHPGWAGVSAITAAALAKQGFFGPKQAYEGRYGLFNLHLGADDKAELALCTAGLGEVWELMNVAFKPYPACHFNHAFADATLALKDEHGLTAKDVESVTARIHQTQASVVCEPEGQKRHPQNAYDAQFSVPYIIAASMVRGRFTLDELDAEALGDPDILALCQRVGYEIDPESAFPRYYSGEVVIRTKDGRELRHRESANRGSDANPLHDSDIIEKFWSNATRAVSRRRAQRVLDAVMELDDAPDLEDLDAALCLD